MRKGFRKVWEKTSEKYDRGKETVLIWELKKVLWKRKRVYVRDFGCEVLSQVIHKARLLPVYDVCLVLVNTKFLM